MTCNALSWTHFPQHGSVFIVTDELLFITLSVNNSLLKDG